MKIWRYRLSDRIVLPTPELEQVEFANRWIDIRDGCLTIAAEYSWDGCSPSWKLPARPILPRGFWVGTWDGPLGTDGRPVTWLASLGHDALCQFRAEIQGLCKAATIKLFARHLHEGGAPKWMCALYPLAVSQFGPQQWHGDTDMIFDFNNRQRS